MVDFSVTNLGGSSQDAEGAGKKAAAPSKKQKDAPLVSSEAVVTGDAAAFTVQPSSWEIPPHEPRYVSVYFHPAEMRAYRALFTAKLPQNPDPESSKLEFQLAGKGTLPCITMEKPVGRDESGKVLVDFGSLSLGKSRRNPLIVRNDGIIPVTALFEMELSPHFSFVAKAGSITLEPGDRREMSMQFQPTGPSEKESPYTCQIRMTVLHNQYESTQITLTGECFVNDLAFEFDGDGDFDDDQLDFKQVDLKDGEAFKEERFSLRNNCTEPLRYEFEPHPHFTFTPLSGHIQAGQSKDIKAVFKAAETVKCKDELLKVTSRRIKYLSENLDQAMMEWDSELCEVRPARQDEIDVWKQWQADPRQREITLSPSKEAEKSKKPKPAAKDSKQLSVKNVVQNSYAQLKEVIFNEDGTAMASVGLPEPECNLDVEKVQQIRLNGIADFARFSCESSQIVFRPTAMFQTRVHTFTIQNESLIPIPFTFAMEKNTSAGITRPPTMGGKPVYLPNPFTIDPLAGEIPGEGSEKITIKFSPQEVDDYQYILHCDMPNLPEDQQPLSVYLGGQAVRPIVHFELENDDHYLADRNNALKNELGVPGAIEAASIRVVEVTSKGTRVRNTKRFHVVNPTSATYDFEWVTQGEPSPAWRCQTNKGLILSGRRGEMIFEFTPEDVSISESFFRFKVPSQGLDELFLFVGVVADPHIALDTTRVDFNALMLGQMATETVHLVNHEHLPFAFAFDRMSVLQGMEEESRKRPVLEVNPMTGMVPPDGRTAVEITFCPREEKFHNFNLLCNVRKKPTALSLNVKGEGYAVHCKLQMEDKSASGAGMVDLSKAPSSNVVDFGNVHLNERAVKKIALSNTGKFNFDYIWDRPSNTSPMLQIVGGRMGGSIRKGERVELTVEFHPVSEVVLDGTQLTCTVAGKDDYVLGIFGRGVKPGLQFSFTKFDFGACFLTPPGANPLVEQKMLTVTNRSGSSNLSLTCTFQRDRALDVRCDPTVLEPGLALNIPILFTPREARAYVFSVPFLVNGSYNVNVIILGEGVVARLELANPSHAHINFGSVVEGGEVAKQLRLVNRSKRPLEFQLMDPGAEDGPNKGALHSVDVSFFPIAPTVLVPRASCTIDLRFVPTRRLAPFSEDLMIKYGGMVRKLSALAGQCTGMEVALETDAIPFGVVCMGSQRARKLNFENSGDMPARFKWQESSFGQHFSVTPLEGVVAPMAETSFEVVFRPKAIDDDIRQEGMRLFVEGTSSLALTCTGMCVPQPADTVKELVFNARTRKSQAQSINIKNPTDTPWYLSPILSGEHWSADEELAVPAKSEARFELVYKPKAMTKGGTSHEGSIFFALPDGSALLYNLRGTADEPESEGSHTHNAVAKQSLPVQVEVKNWLEMPQKFTVKIEIVDGDPLATFISGTNTIDVPPFGLKGYAMKFYAYKEGTTKVRVSFTNEHSGEYMFHDFRFDTTEPGVLETISLETPVRQHARHLITIDNPLPANIPVSFSDRWWSCTNPYVNLTRLGEISGNSEGVFEVDYRPLLETSTAMDTELNFSCVELGKYKYQLRLKANPPTSMPTLHFEAPLGNTQQETFLFRAFNKAATVFKCSVQQPLFFEVQKSIDVEAALTWDGSDVKVDITFEPERLGEVHDTLVVRSEEGGEYRCALVGVCTPALPQGPFVISNGTSKDIIFRNVFNEARDFQFAVDDSRFVATPVSQNIASKSSKAVSVKFTATGSSSSNIPAKLFISCPSLPEMPPWIFYLQGQD